MEFIVKKDEDKFELMKKLVEFQKTVKQPKKDSVNPFAKSKYSSLSAVQDVVTTALSKLGLSFFQDYVNSDSENGGKTISVQTIIVSELGMIKFNPIVLPIEKLTAQGIGSASTYARRYALTTNLSIVADEDDDGNSASRNNQSRGRNYRVPYHSNNSQRRTTNSKPTSEPTGQQKVTKMRLNAAEQRLGHENAVRLFNQAKIDCSVKDLGKLPEKQLESFNNIFTGLVKDELSKRAEENE